MHNNSRWDSSSSKELKCLSKNFHAFLKESHVDALFLWFLLLLLVDAVKLRRMRAVWIQKIQIFRQNALPAVFIRAFSQLFFVCVTLISQIKRKQIIFTDIFARKISNMTWHWCMFVCARTTIIIINKIYVKNLQKQAKGKD